MKLRPFELALVIIFVVLALMSLLLFSIYEPPPDAPEGNVTGVVDIWGTMPEQGMQAMLATYRENFESYEGVSYRYIPVAQFESQLINALADQRGPDLVVFSHEQLADLRPRLFPETYEQFPLPDIRSRYVDGAEIYALNDGLYARPIAVDPLVMYWNRDILATFGFLEAPTTWEELVNVQFPDLIDRGFDRSINRSVVAMGEYGNVRNSFGVISMLLLQAGSRGVVETEREYVIALNESLSGGGAPLRSATEFYTRFRQPDNTLYSWNGSFVGDREQFIGEELAFYFGYASEAPVIERLNPNLNFDVAEVPQSAVATVRRTYGRHFAIGLLRTTDNGTAAQSVMRELSRPSVADTIAIDTAMVPATRATVNAGNNSKYGRVAYRASAVAYGWLTPDIVRTEQIFGDMVTNINVNRSTLDGAVGDAIELLEREY